MVFSNVKRFCDLAPNILAGAYIVYKIFQRSVNYVINLETTKNQGRFHKFFPRYIDYVVHIINLLLIKKFIF